jgi:hypothetical protein
MFHYPIFVAPSHRSGRSGCRRRLQLVAACREANKLSQFVANGCKMLRPYSIERLAMLRLKICPKSASWALICRLAKSAQPGVGLAKRTPVVQIDKYSSDEQSKRANSRNIAVLEFWQRRSGQKLSLSTAREMQSNVEGLIGLLAQWDQEDCAKSNSADRLREQHVSAKG